MTRSTTRAVSTRRCVRAIVAWSVACFAASFARAGSARGAADDAGRVSFSRDVAPILLDRCQGCHGPEKSKGDYRLDTFDRLLTPGSSGEPVADAGEAGAEPPVPAAGHARRGRPDAEEGRARSPPPRSRSSSGGSSRGRRSTGTDRTLRRSPPTGRTPPPRRRTRGRCRSRRSAFSPDGTTLAAGGYHEVTLWDAATGQLKSRLGNLPQRILAIDFVPRRHAPRRRRRHAGHERRVAASSTRPARRQPRVLGADRRPDARRALQPRRQASRGGRGGQPGTVVRGRLRQAGAQRSSTTPTGCSTSRSAPTAGGSPPPAGTSPRG